MKKLKQEIYNNLPIFFKNLFVTMYNLRFLKTHRKKYYQTIDLYKEVFYKKDLSVLKSMQNDRFMEMINFVKKSNPYYSELFHNIEINSIEDLQKLPILSKENLRDEKIKSNIDEKLLPGYTGGTTGKSLSFALTEDDFIERQACLDFFRGMYGYKFRDEVAWFSGKEIISPKDVKKNIFWVRDYINHITYYSTFHVTDKYIDYMIDNLNMEKPFFLAGFPSAIYDIAKRWEKVDKPVKMKLKAIFPTSEPLFEHQKSFLENFFNCPVPDQYASSEGAPFIYECPKGNLHYDMYSGIFEKKDEVENESDVLVTSFTTHYMPLIRYDIGDKVVFDDEYKKCKCMSSMPLVKKIIGRSVAFLVSKERGKVTVSNISNVVKYLKIIDKFQVIQNDIDSILVKVVCPDSNQDLIIKDLEYELRYRLGDAIMIKYEFVQDIPNEKNGKFLLVKNNIPKEKLSLFV